MRKLSDRFVSQKRECQGYLLQCPFSEVFLSYMLLSVISFGRHPISSPLVKLEIKDELQLITFTHTDEWFISFLFFFLSVV